MIITCNNSTFTYEFPYENPKVVTRLPHGWWGCHNLVTTLCNVGTRLYDIVQGCMVTADKFHNLVTTLYNFGTRLYDNVKGWTINSIHVYRLLMTYEGCLVVVTWFFIIIL